MGYKQAYKIIEEGRKRILFVHGDMSDPFWGKMSFNEMQKEKYKGFDFVVSGHTHVPHLVEIFYEDDNSEMRNKKKTTFLNHGSVGQPRNHCKEAQYAIFDANTEMFTFYKVPYNISLEQSFFTGKMDVFYRERLNSGI
jgi:predicted phosphodiesterase